MKNFLPMEHFLQFHRFSFKYELAGIFPEMNLDSLFETMREKLKS